MRCRSNAAKPGPFPATRRVCCRAGAISAFLDKDSYSHRLNVDAAFGLIELADRSLIPIDRISDLRGPLFLDAE